MNPLLALRELGHIRVLFELQLGCELGGEGCEGELDVQESGMPPLICIGLRPPLWTREERCALMTM
jgi:hypothetical protein